MIKKILDYPYHVTAIIFLILLAVGKIVLHWRENHYAFLLLLFFIITLGIRLDEIKSRLESIDKTLSKIGDRIEKDSQQL